MRGKSRNERTAHYLETINSLGSLLMRTDSAHEAAWIVAKHAVGELGYIDCIIYLINDDKELGMNDICKVKIRTTKPLMVDSYRENRTTGSIILVDDATNETVAAGMIV